MTDNYRIKYKTGDFEVEVESSDKEFVESKLKQLIQDGQEQIVKPVKKQTTTPTQRVKSTSDELENSDSVDVVSVVNAINDAEKHALIEKKILQKVNQLSRILLVFYYVNEINNAASITTGDVENITHQLGIRVKRGNAGTCIKSNTKFFAAETVRKQGAIVKYKINRKGIEEFERIIAS